MTAWRSHSLCHPGRFCRYLVQHSGLKRLSASTCGRSWSVTTSSSSRFLWPAAAGMCAGHVHAGTMLRHNPCQSTAFASCAATLQRRQPGCGQQVSHRASHAPHTGRRCCRGRGVMACRAQPETLPDAAFDPLARFEEQLRLLPLAAGVAGIAGTLLNRLLSGIAPIADAGSAQSRADVLLIGMSGALVLTGLQWLALAPKETQSVAPAGQRLDWLDPSLPPAAAEELRWAWRALSSSSRCCGLVAFWDGRPICQLGAAAGGVEAGAAQPGEQVAKAMASERGNYLANLTLYPGRFEFLQYFPDSTQGAALAPMGGRGCLVAAVDAVRGFSRLDQVWLATIADKLDATLSGSDDEEEDSSSKSSSSALAEV